MDIIQILNENDEQDFIFASLEIENHNKINTNSRLRFWYNHCRENFDKIDGDIFEFGVFRGNSLISMAILLKRLGSKKNIYGFDSYNGFPKYDTRDNLESFSNAYSHHFNEKIISNFELLKKINSGLQKDELTPKNISTSNDFQDNSLVALNEKINILNLDNIILIEGYFKETVPHFFSEFKGSIFSANIDCDLYDGYKITLPPTYSNLEKGGYIHLDEYYSLKFPGARIACNEFFEAYGIKPKKQDTPKGEFERWYIEK